MPFQIFGAESAANAAIVTPAALGISYNSGRICGRQLHYTSAQTADTTVCCKYKLIVLCIYAVWIPSYLALYFGISKRSQVLLF